MATATQTESISAAIELAPAAGKQGPANPPTAETETSQRQGYDRATYLKLISSGFSFFVAGVNDGSIGALLPYVIREYSVTKAIVSSV